MALTSTTPLDTEFGKFIVNYHEFPEGNCVTLTIGEYQKPGVLVRMHSSCVFSESFHSIDCDCDLQLAASMAKMSNEGAGIVVYIYQEGRGQGLKNKIQAMGLEAEKGYDTVQAFQHLGLGLDIRDYTVAIKALQQDLKISDSIRLVSNNPRKCDSMTKAGFKILEKVKVAYPINDIVKKYLTTKKNKLQHEIDYV